MQFQNRVAKNCVALLNRRAVLSVSFYDYQGRSKLDNWGGGADIHIFVFTHHKSNSFQKKLIVQNPNI